MRVNFGIAWAAVVAYGLVGMTASQCTSSQAFVASGESFAALGELAPAVDDAMWVAFTNKAVSRDEYVAWSDFYRHFKSVYVPLSDLWLAATASNDSSLAASAAAPLASLAVELAEWAKKCGVRQSTMHIGGDE